MATARTASPALLALLPCRRVGTASPVLPALLAFLLCLLAGGRTDAEAAYRGDPEDAWEDEEEEEEAKLEPVYEEQADGFSIRPPAGWKPQWKEEAGDMVFLGPRVEGMRANLVITCSARDEHAGSLAERAEAFLSARQRLRGESFRLEQRKEMVLDGRTAISLVVAYDLPARAGSSEDAPATTIAITERVLFADGEGTSCRLVYSTTSHHYGQEKTARNIDGSARSLRLSAPQFRRAEDGTYIFDSPACSFRAPQWWRLQRAESASGLTIYGGPPSRGYSVAAITVNRIPRPERLAPYADAVRRLLLRGRTAIPGSERSGEISGLPAREFAWEEESEKDHLWRYCAIIDTPGRAKYVVRVNVRFAEVSDIREKVKRLVASFQVKEEEDLSVDATPSPEGEAP